jgi:hypothetical protein
MRAVSMCCAPEAAVAKPNETDPASAVSATATRQTRRLIITLHLGLYFRLYRIPSSHVLIAEALEAYTIDGSALAVHRSTRRPPGSPIHRPSGLPLIAIDIPLTA